MDWPLIITVALAALAVVIFLLVINLKDEKKFENQIENDYRKRKTDEGDIDLDDKRR